MQKPISTETVILITLLCKKMPNLFKYIVQYSVPKKQQQEISTSSHKLSAKQISDARNHSSTIIRQTLNTIANIQKAINTVDNKINNLLEQRSVVENTLLTILSTKNQG